jgi:hypothetical protein
LVIALLAALAFIWALAIVAAYCFGLSVGESEVAHVFHLDLIKKY